MESPVTECNHEFINFAIWFSPSFGMWMSERQTASGDLYWIIIYHGALLYGYASGYS